jgi:methanethiol S-methyltransferase
MNEHPAAYGLWSLVIINSAVFIIFALSFTRPRTRRDWRSLGAFGAFVVALFTEMYGFPLTIYLLSGWLGRLHPGLNLYSHESGHLWEAVFAWKGNPHWNPLHILSNVLIVGGLILLSAAWPVLHKAQRRHGLAVSGPYALVRHPQYTAFLLIMLGFLVQWPTLITLAMFPVLTVMYVQLARREEAEVAAESGDEYARYAARTPRFIPRLRAGNAGPAWKSEGSRDEA